MIIEWQTAIFNAFSALVIALISPLIFKYINERRFSGKRISLIAGKRWTGEISQEVDGEIWKLPVTVEFKSWFKNLRGKAQVVGREHEFDLEVDGYLPHDDYMVLRYENKDKSIQQFGSIVARLNPSGNEIRGEFVEHGHREEKIVSGDLVLLRNRL